jgi:hypothetical protein
MAADCNWPADPGCQCERCDVALLVRHGVPVIARDPWPLRQLATGCKSCQHSIIFCDCVRYTDGTPCCDECDHRGGAAGE